MDFQELEQQQNKKAIRMTILMQDYAFKQQVCGKNSHIITLRSSYLLVSSKTRSFHHIQYVLSQNRISK